MAATARPWAVPLTRPNARGGSSVEQHALNSEDRKHEEVAASDRCRGMREDASADGRLDGPAAARGEREEQRRQRVQGDDRRRRDQQQGGELGQEDLARAHRERAERAIVAAGWGRATAT